MPWAEHVEVAQANGVNPVAARKHVGIELIDVFGDSVGAERLAYDLLHLGQGGVITIGGAASRVCKAFEFGVAGGDQHI